MNGLECLRAALKREVPDRVPTFEWFLDAAVTRALTGHEDPVEAAAALDLDAVNVRPDYRRRMIDADTFVDELGVTRKLTGDCIPCVVDSPVKDIARHGDFAFPDPEAPGRFETLERALAAADGRRAAVLNLRDGFSDMRDLLGYQEAMALILLEPALFMEMLDRVVEYNLALARAAVRRYGIEIVATTDDVANAAGPLIRPAVYFDRVGPAFRKVVRGYRELGCFVIKHCDGNVRPFMDFWIDCGIHCLDPIDPAGGMDMAAVKRAYGDRICLKGNIDCAGVLQYGTEAEVEAAVRECLRAGGPGGLILSSSNSIHKGVKPENYRAMLRALRREGRPAAAAN